jgi:hypothetical protein
MKCDRHTCASNTLRNFGIGLLSKQRLFLRSPFPCSRFTGVRDGAPQSSRLAKLMRLAHQPKNFGSLLALKTVATFFFLPNFIARCAKYFRPSRTRVAFCHSTLSRPVDRIALSAREVRQGIVWRCRKVQGFYGSLDNTARAFRSSLSFPSSPWGTCL